MAGVMEAVTALLLGANTNAGSAVFLIRAEPSAPGADIPMPHIWFEPLSDVPAANWRPNNGTTAVGGTPTYGRNLYRSLVQVTAVGDSFGQAHAVIGQLSSKLDGWRGTAGGVSVKGIFIEDERPDYSVPDDVGSEQIDMTVWYRRS